MAKLTASAVGDLLNKQRQTPLVSLYMPTHNAGTPPNMTEDQLRFKNLRHRTTEIIKASPKVDIRAGRALQNQLRNIADDLDFWENRTYGFAAFISPDDIAVVDLPIDCDEYVSVDSRFHVSPLIGLLGQWLEFYVLVLSQKEMRLFAGDLYGLRPTDIDLPTADTSTRQRQEGLPEKIHTPSPSERGRPEYFGKRFPLTTKEDRLDFFRATDRAVRKYADPKCPLILAGPEQDIEMYRSISQYPHILSDHVASTNSATTPRSLTPAIMQLVSKEIMSKRRRDVVERYHRLAGNAAQRASSELAAIRDAAHKGRVDTLLIKLIRNTTDTVRDNKTNVPKLQFFPAEQMAIADAIALQTWRDHGNVVLLDDTSTAPFNAALAAIMRY